MKPTSPTLIPYLTIRDARKSIEFYQKAFGFQLQFPESLEGDEAIEHVEMMYRDVLIMFSPEGSWGGTAKCPASLGSKTPMTLYLYCDSVDTMYKQAMQAGAISVMEPSDAFWGDRICNISDPDGFEWMFAEPLHTNCCPHEKGA